MIRNTFVKVNNHQHGNDIVEAFITLGAKNSRILTVGKVGQYVGVIFDTITCISTKELLELKGHKVITTLEDLYNMRTDAYKPRPIQEGRTKSSVKDSGQTGRQAPPPPRVTSKYKEGFKEGFEIGVLLTELKTKLSNLK